MLLLSPPPLSPIPARGEHHARGRSIIYNDRSLIVTTIKSLNSQTHTHTHSTKTKKVKNTFLFLKTKSKYIFKGNTHLHRETRSFNFFLAKMKYTTGILALFGSSSAEPLLNRAVRQSGPDQERRYNQLTDMMNHYNADFDERKYWTYGCQCLILGN